jgi:threonine 3-dehydrogenase
MPPTMQALVKPEPKAGIEVREVPLPEFGPSDVLVKVEAASVCGTDLHIYDWDPWAQGRIKPPLIPGHEFCGVVAAVGKHVTSVKEGDFVSAEMHVACGKCLLCRTGQAHICPYVKIIGVDANGAFAEFVTIPETNIWKLDPSLPREYASILDPLGNAVHTVLAGEIAAKSVAVIGCGPIGLFSIAIAQACGARAVYALEINEHRRALATQMGANAALNPLTDDVHGYVLEQTGGLGVDVVIEMSGHADAIRQGFKILRTGGRVSLLGIPPRPMELDLAQDVIFKGAIVQGINGRKMYETWFQMEALLKTGKLDLSPVITHRLPMTDFAQCMQLLKSGEASKIVLYPNK